MKPSDHVRALMQHDTSRAFASEEFAAVAMKLRKKELVDCLALLLECPPRLPAIWHLTPMAKLMSLADFVLRARKPFNARVASFARLASKTMARLTNEKRWEER